MFIVPKHHFDPETGELTGERNGVYVTGVEHKMGIKVSNTCELTFGDPGVGGGEPARGWLLGEVHDGIAQMFQVIENARMMVGTKAIATLSTGYLNALEYAKERVQGADLTQAADKTAPRVTITHHPDVRRSLMTQKSYAEAMRSLVLYTASWQDRVMVAEHAGERDELAMARQRPAAADREGLRLGALVGAARHRVAADLRRFGLPDRLPDRAVRPRRQDRHPLRGHHRDPGPGLLLPQDRQGPGPGARPPGRGDRGVRRTPRPGNGRLKVERGLLAKALEDANAIVGAMINDLMSADASAEGGDVRNIYKVGLNTSRLLMALGDVVCAWLLLRGAEVALTKLAGEVSAKDKAFYEGKVAAAQFFAQNMLPKLSRRAGDRRVHRPGADGPLGGQLLDGQAEHRFAAEMLTAASGPRIADERRAERHPRTAAERTSVAICLQRVLSSS